MANASQQTELEALRARVKALEQENDELLRERPAGASAASIDPRGPCCLMVGLTTLDIHACPVPRIPEGGGVEFVEEIHLSLAGTAGGTASTAASLGVPVRLVAALGDDEKAELLRQLMGRAGILCDALQSAEGYATSATVINVRPNGDRPCLHAFGASDQLSLSDAEAGRLAALAAAQVESHGTAIVHVGGTGLREGCPQEGSVLRLLRSLRAACCPEPEASAAAAGPSPLVVTMDLIAPHGGTLGLLASLLPMVDYFMPSLEEAEAITGCEGPGGCARRFLELGVRRAVVLKAGASGSYYVGAACQGDSSAGDDVLHIPACSGLKVVDTTGAGDAYCAGFIAGLSRGMQGLEACRVGTAAAALCCTGVGSDAGNRSWEATAAFMEEKLPPAAAA